MPEYLALFACCYENHSTFAPPRNYWVSRYQFDALDLVEAREISRKQRQVLKDDMTYVAPATILELIAKEHPTYKIVQEGQITIPRDELLKVWGLEMQDLHIQR